MSDWNTGIIDEFRANGGHVGGMFEGAPLLLLHHVGARTGVERVNPLMYQTVGRDFAIFASAGGANKHPDWFHNLMAHPDTSIEVGTETVIARARLAEDDERHTIWERQKREWPQFAEYERSTTREVIPVIILERV